MPAVYPTLPKLAVRDGYDDDDLTDIDDEVFIRDGKNGGLKIDDDGGVKRPLMAPRKKCKKSCSFEKHKFPYKALWVPFCYGITALTALIILIILCIFTANIFPMPLTILRNWLSHELKEKFNDSSIVPCTSLATKVLWSRSLPKLTSESPLRSNDVNSDGIEDIIVGFSTGLDSMNPPEYVCALYFDDQVPCLGGVLALNGKNGDTLWTHWTAHAIFSVDCGLDLTNDKIKDCVISGRGGILHAINGRDGTSIWEIPIQDISAPEEQRILDVYDAKFIADIDGDGIGDVIASHAIQSTNIRPSEILMISGVSGNVIHSTTLPETEQLFLAPQKLVHPDGENIFVIVTSSQKQAGGLYVVPQVMLMYGDLTLKKLEHDTGKGVLLPPILVDITSDEVEDIVAAMFNSSIIAYDGFTFEPLWNYTIPNSEVISVPIPGYYNDDDVPDFMVKHQIGAGFPTYYYTVATIIDGKTGKPLLEKPIEDSLSRQMSGLSVTVDGFGNDWFLHWSVDCLNYEGAKEKYQFLRGESLAAETRADLCKLRFNSTLTSNLYALSQHVGPPGISLYFSEDWRAVEFNNSGDSKMDSFANVPFVSERSPKSRKTHQKESSFKNEAEDEIPDVNKYNPETAYEKYGDYKGQKRLTLSEFENDHVPNAGDFNPDYSWKSGRKWPREKLRGDKDYEIAYDGNNNGNIDGDQSMDYTQLDEVREQRSNVEDEGPNDNDSGLKNTGDSNDSVRRKRDSNFTVELTESYNMTENVTFIPESSTVTEIYVDEETTINLDFNGTTNVMDEYNSTAEENDDLDSIMKTAQMYVHNFPNPVENKEEDENIEKIFKRESLKNRSKKGNVGNRIGITPNIVRDHIMRERRKREAENQAAKGNKVEGIQKQPPTGILLPSISKTEGKTSIDLIFSTSWLPSSEISVVLLQEDLDCIHRKKALSENKFQYKDSDDIIKECLSERGVNYKMYQEAMDRENYRISLGQMTIYRMKLECVCPEDMLPNQSCKNISIHQSWPQHLGSFGNGYFKPLHKPKV